MTSSSQRIVLCPFGLPSDAALRESALKTIFACGGDLERVLDAPAGDVERFAKHVARIAALRQGVSREAQPIVLLSRSSPISRCVLDARKVMESAIPSLKVAIWLLAVDPGQDPAFVATALRLAPLASDDLSLAPLWVVPGRGPFIVFSATTPSASLLALRREQLLLLEEHGAAPQSATRPIAGRAPVEAPVRWKGSGSR